MEDIKERGKKMKEKVKRMKGRGERRESLVIQHTVAPRVELHVLLFI